MTYHFNLSSLTLLLDLSADCWVQACSCWTSWGHLPTVRPTMTPRMDGVLSRRKSLLCWRDDSLLFQRRCYASQLCDFYLNRSLLASASLQPIPWSRRVDSPWYAASDWPSSLRRKTTACKFWSSPSARPADSKSQSASTYACSFQPRRERPQTITCSSQILSNLWALSLLSLTPPLPFQSSHWSKSLSCNVASAIALLCETYRRLLTTVSFLQVSLEPEVKLVPVPPSHPAELPGC